MLHLEGQVLHVYHDQAGKPTIGEGHLCSNEELETGEFPGGVQATSDEKFRWAITSEQSRAIFRADVFVRAKDVDRLVTFPLDGGADEGPQRDALILWHFNTGGLPGSTLLKVLNEGKLDLVPYEMMRWNHRWDPKTGQKVVDGGLTARRRAEGSIFVNGYEHDDSDVAMAHAVAKAEAAKFTLFDLIPTRSPLDTLPEGDAA